ncbi:hypothetical protein AArcSl_0235 [Halalkaliarchaeum desulfuricum]|uniref:Uncharacterized protein n=1 Tax=Halalkaliarchaeum desulfuricum TaxID=2055893 RepID=A0A343TFL8_9EURY|nr:hypothetical protein [Halalkaliarchaeum desulfuricum]AUX07890.1 hypothetical protein AArcSl_0235 [Halalkaliarchaeum desulfuricum]
MNLDSTTLRKAIGRNEVRSASKLLLSAVALVFVLYLATLLPGIDRLVPQTPVTFAAVVTAIATVVVVGLLVYTAPKFASVVRLVLDGPKDVVENLASVVHWLVVLVAVIVAHSGLTGISAPVFDGFEWLYDGIFLLLALPVLAVIAARLYAGLDPSADLIADAIVGDGEKDPNTEGDGTR